MKRSVKNITCGHCGSLIDVELIESRHYSAFGLDGRPDCKENFPQIHICPCCGYASFNLSKKPEKDCNAILCSEEYTALLSDCSSFQKKIELLKLLASSEKKEYLIKLDLYSCWDYEYNGCIEQAETMRLKATELLGEYVQEKVNWELLVMYIDSLRQLGEFEIAGELCREMLPVLMQDKDLWGKYAPLLNFESTLVNQQDSKPHTTSEVSL